MKEYSMNFNEVMRAWSKAVVAQFHYRILLLSLLPLFLSLVLWGGGMWWGMQSLIDFVQNLFMTHDGFAKAGSMLATFGMIAIKIFIVPMLSMWLLLPLMIMTSLFFIGVLVMPAISNHVGQRNYPQLEQRQGGSILSSLMYSLFSFAIFGLLWLCSVPLLFIPVLHLIVQPLLWGWLTYRVMSYDALARHADVEERKFIMRTHRPAFVLMGTVAGLFGALPSMLWLGGAMAAFFFPIFASIAIWTYLLIFIFTGLWFQHYCLEALQNLRRQKAIVLDGSVTLPKAPVGMAIENVTQV
jgi:hypothetical protein